MKIGRFNVPGSRDIECIECESQEDAWVCALAVCNFLEDFAAGRMEKTKDTGMLLSALADLKERTEELEAWAVAENTRS